jgi:CTP synthase
MKNILIIDDEQDVADVIKAAIEEGIAGSSCNIEIDFGKSVERIREIRPDAIVLDIMKGQHSNDLPGQRTWKDVWDSTFCPIVIYTGWEGYIQPAVPESHPFVKRIAKGGGTLAQVVSTLNGFAPAVASVSKLRAEVDAVIHKVLRDTAGEAKLPMDDPKYLLHAGRRRIAAVMDDCTVTDNRKMECWEHYLVPAIGTDCLTGDILHKHGTDMKPENFRLMLSPSCDLARGGKNITGALIAKCHPPVVMLDKFKNAVLPENDKELKKQLTSLVLSQGAWNGWFPLPAFANTIPEMVANLKDVEVVLMESLHAEDKLLFDRVASIDSPFREQVAWAYLTTAARPGMPDRDLKPWAEAIAKSLAATEPTK